MSKMAQPRCHNEATASKHTPHNPKNDGFRLHKTTFRGVIVIAQKSYQPGEKIIADAGGALYISPPDSEALLRPNPNF